MTTKSSVTIALAGNANVGKSAVFNQLTGLNQAIGNWPGKTVERAEGTLHFEGYTIKVIDLPGIYSLSTFSMEEMVARDYIITERPDVIVNVVDASALERNLYLTIQLLELQAPIAIALNQIDFAKKKGLEIDSRRLSRRLGTPVVPTVAVTGVGITDLLSKIVQTLEKKDAPLVTAIQYGKEIEESLLSMEKAVRDWLPRLCTKYPVRWTATKLLEKDEKLWREVQALYGGTKVLAIANEIVDQMEKVHGEPSSVVLASERYAIANHIAKDVSRIVSPPKVTLEDRLGTITAHRILGYPILATIVAVMFGTIFIIGDFFVRILDNALKETLTFVDMGLTSANLPAAVVHIITDGLLSGIGAGITIALPYIVPFYIILAVLEDSGYLPRAAFLMDNVMHKIGLHGKAFIPLLLGYGCNVPACAGCRILETDRERFLAAFVVVSVPCAARTVIILGLVGRYVGLPAVLALYLFDLILVLLLGRLAFRLLPGEPVGLVMEMPPYRTPSLKAVGKKTWVRTKDFIYVAFPLIIVGSIVLEVLMITGAMRMIVDLMKPLIGGWLGLPSITGIPLIFGILRKELALILLAEVAGTTSFDQVLTPLQMIVFALVTMIYIPCISTMAELKREFGWRRALGVGVVDVLLAIVIGGLVYHLLSFFTK